MHYNARLQISLTEVNMELLDFFIASAYAQDGSPQGGLMSFLPLIVIFVIFYFLLIRPQMKRAKEHRKLVSELAVGDEVVTNGGLLGKITKVGESFVTVELADNVQIKLQRHAVASVMPKGTVKSA
jgi:preprotein translocase subunit YajC